MSNPDCSNAAPALETLFDAPQPARTVAAATRPMRTTPYLNLLPAYDVAPGLAMGRMAHSRGSAGPLYLRPFLPMMSSSDASPQTAVDARACLRDRCGLECHGRT